MGRSGETLVILLMVQKSQTTTWDGAKTLVNNGINQLVQDFFHQQYVEFDILFLQHLLYMIMDTYSIVWYFC